MDGQLAVRWRRNIWIHALCRKSLIDARLSAPDFPNSTMGSTFWPSSGCLYVEVPGGTIAQDHSLE
jgi:hypothetical protein